MGCESCYCNMHMEKREGCLYMFGDARERLKDICPCKDCIVQLMCTDRYNICEEFNHFLKEQMVVVTPEASKFNTI